MSKSWRGTAAFARGADADEYDRLAAHEWSLAAALNINAWSDFTALPYLGCELYDHQVDSAVLFFRRLAPRGSISDEPNHHVDLRKVGLPSDDTQLAFWTLEHVLDNGRVVPDRLAATIADGRRIFGVGHTVKAFVIAHQNGQPWYEAAQRSAGNGAVMRIAPVVVPYLYRPSTGLWRDAILLAGAVTHNDASSIGACVAIAGME